MKKTIVLMVFVGVLLITVSAFAARPYDSGAYPSFDKCLTGGGECGSLGQAIHNANEMAELLGYRNFIDYYISEGWEFDTMADLIHGL